MAEVIRLYGENCHICFEQIDMKAPRKAGVTGWERGLQLDHVIPLSKGGPDTLENVKPSHGICNLKKQSVL
jgi:5-methylcytosine-specific restriction endonuclease McrA